MEHLSSLYERWVNLARWQKWLIIAAVGVITFLALFAFRVKPLKEELVYKESQVESLSSNLNRLKVIERRRDTLKREIERLEREIEKIESMLPTGEERVSQILNSITGADSGMLLLSVKKEPELSTKYYLIHPYTVKLLGNYPSFVKWCERLSRSSRIFNFEGIQIHSTNPTKLHGVRESQKGQAPPQYTIWAEVKLNAFTLKR
jgi:type IV pilus assembly protein PilO